MSTTGLMDWRPAWRITGAQKPGPKPRYAVVACGRCGSNETKSSGHVRFGNWVRRKIYCRDCGRWTFVECTG